LFDSAGFGWKLHVQLMGPIELKTEISYGNILVAASILSALMGVLRKVRDTEKRFENAMHQLLLEHEILVRDYCERKGMKRDDLITRVRTILEEE